MDFDGIPYVAVCTSSDSNNLEQTKKKFSYRWTAYRASWKKLNQISI